MSIHLIFEGAELTGKSFIISQVYDFIEKKYSTSRNILNGCHWFNLDIGIFGSKYASQYIKQYLAILSLLKRKNLILEKFYIADQVYQKFYNNKNIKYTAIEQELKKLNFKIILCTIEKDEDLIKQRLKDRINLYPHYKRIATKPKNYIKQQDLYIEFIKKSKLPYLEIDLTKLPNKKAVNKILQYGNI